MLFRLEAVSIVAAYILLPNISTVLALFSSGFGGCDGDPLVCYLDSITFNFPDFCEDVQGTEFCVSSFACTGLNIGTLPSAYIPPTSLGLNATAVGTSCEGDYKFGLISGTATGTISNVDASLELYLGKDGEYPSTAALTKCEVPSIDVDVSLSGLVVDILSPVLEKFIIDVVQDYLCDGIQGFVATNVTNWLVETADPWMQAVISSEPSEPHQFDRHFMMWGDSILSKFRHLMDQIGGLSGILETLQCLLADSTFSSSRFNAYKTETSARDDAAAVREGINKITPATKVNTKNQQQQQQQSDRLVLEVEQLLDNTEDISSKDQSAEGEREHLHQQQQRGRSSVFDALSSTTLLASGEVRLPLDLPGFDVSITLADVPPGCTSTLSLDALRFRGLDSLTEIEILQPVAYNNYTLHNVISFSDLSVTAEMTINIVENEVTNTGTDSRRRLFGEDGYTEHIEISLENMNTTFVLDAVLAVNEFLLRSLFLDQLSTPNCWFYLVDEASISNLQLRFSNLTNVEIVQNRGSAEGLEFDIVGLINNALKLLTTSPEGFGDLTADLINGFMQGSVRELINDDLLRFIADGKHDQPCLTHFPYDDSNEFVPWMNSTLIHYFDLLVNELIGADGANQVLSCATNGTGALYFDTNYLTIGLGGLNSFYEVELLAPAAAAESPLVVTDGQSTAAAAGTGYPAPSALDDQSQQLVSAKNTKKSSNRRLLTSAGTDGADVAGYSNYDLLTSLGVGYCPEYGDSDCNPLTLNLKYKEQKARKARRMLSSSEAGDSIKEALSHLDMTLSFTNISLFLDTFVKVDRNAMRDTKYGDVGVTGCLATSVNDFTVENLAIDLSTATLSWAKGDLDITDITESLFGLITDPARLDSRNNDISKSLASAGDTCANGGVNPNAESVSYNKKGDDDDDDSIDWKWQLFIVIAGCVFSLLALAYAYRYWGTAKKFLCVPVLVGGGVPLTSDEEDKQRLLELRRTNKSGLLTEIWYGLNCKNALVFHHDVPIWLRVLFPIAVLGNMACFLNSNLDEEAVSVMLSVTLGDKTKDMGSIFDFGLKSTVWDMWDAEVYALAVLIFFFSGMWPYVKLFAMLVCWLAPPVLLPISYRETALVLLDALGKWSLIDFYVMVLMLCAFYYNIYIGDSVSANVTVKPKWGFYGFLLATMISLGLGHIVLACHRLIVEHKMLPIPESISPKESLCSIVYQIDIIAQDEDSTEDNDNEDDDEDEEDDEVDDSREENNQDAQQNITNTSRSKGNQPNNEDTNRIPQERLVNVSVTEEGADGGNSLTGGSEGTKTVPSSTADFETHTTDGSGEITTTTTSGEAENSNSSTNVPPKEEEEEDPARSTILIDDVQRPYAATAIAADRDCTEPQKLSDTASVGSTEVIPCRNRRLMSKASHIDNPPTGTAMLVQLTPFGVLFVLCSILVTAIFTIAGTFMITMSFDFQGLVGVLLKDESTVDYSFVDVGNEIPEHSGIPDDFAVRWMQASFFVFGQVMPFSLLLLLTVIWLTPMSLVWQKTLMVVCEVFNAWASLDVFCVAIAAALLEIEQFAEFIVGDSCDEVDKLLEEYADDLLDGNDVCFDVKAELTANSWVIFVAAALLIIVATPILGMAHSAVKLRQKRIEHAVRLFQTNPHKFHHLRNHRISQSSGVYGDTTTGKDALMKGNKREISIDQHSEEFSTLIEPLLEQEDEEWKIEHADKQHSRASSSSASAAHHKDLLAVVQPADTVEGHSSSASLRSTMVGEYVNQNVAAAVGADDTTGDEAATEPAVEKDDDINSSKKHNAKKSCWSKFTYQNCIIACVNLAQRCWLVSVVTMPIAEANQAQAERLLAQRQAQPLSLNWLWSAGSKDKRSNSSSSSNNSNHCRSENYTTVINDSSQQQQPISVTAAVNSAAAGHTRH